MIFFPFLAYILFEAESPAALKLSAIARFLGFYRVAGVLYDARVLAFLPGLKLTFGLSLDPLPELF